MNATIKKEIYIGDAGWPFLLTIDVEFEKQHPNVIIVTDYTERECPHDNPSDKWWDRMKEVVEEYFYEQDENNCVVFHNQ